MKKTYSFASANNSNKNTTFFLNNNTSEDYSKILDDIIAANIIKKNSYLFDTYDTTYSSTTGTKPIIIGGYLKDDDEFAKATKFLANYNTYKKTYNIPIVYGKMYTLSDGTPIVFSEDEIQIGFDVYRYSDFSNNIFLKTIEPAKKDLIINIFTNGIGNIKINIF